MEHADKLVERIIFLDGFPNMQVLDPLHIGQNVKEVLDCDLAAEMSARALYEEAATHCHAVKDYVSRDLFEKLMHDEEEHIDFLETQLDLVAKLGLSFTPSITSASSTTPRLTGLARGAPARAPQCLPNLKLAAVPPRRLRFSTSVDRTLVVPGAVVKDQVKS